MQSDAEGCNRTSARIRLEPMYTAVTVRCREGMRLRALDGHAYDLSAAGVRIELDEPLPVDERVEVAIQLPGEAEAVTGSARVIWINDENDDPGPRRMALAFTGFRSREDHTRLVRHINGSSHQRAA